MEVKLFEVRDEGTFIPCVGMKLTHRTREEKFLLRRAGYAEDQIAPGYSDQDEPYILFGNLFGKGLLNYDAFAWPNRTMARAHMHVITNWANLKSGDVVDVQFIHGETPAAKVSEMMQDR